MDNVNINQHLDFEAISTVALNCCLLGTQIAISLTKLPLLFYRGSEFKRQKFINRHITTGK